MTTYNKKIRATRSDGRNLGLSQKENVNNCLTGLLQEVSQSEFFFEFL